MLSCETVAIQAPGVGSDFVEVYERHYGRVVRALQISGLDRASAEDVAQEAFIKAFREIGDFRKTSGFYTWLYRITVRICYDRLRCSSVKLETSLPDDFALAHNEDCDTRLLVESLLDRLSPPIRATLALRELEGLDYEEIADILRVPVGTVRSRLNTAREQFRKLYTKAMKEMEDV